MKSKDISVDHPAYTFLRLVEQYQKMDRLIIAYDFDDTVSPYYSSNCCFAASAIRKAREYLDAYLIVYTCNQDEEKIKKYLDKNNIPYDAINENAPFIHFNGKGKLYYNLLLQLLRTQDFCTNLHHNIFYQSYIRLNPKGFVYQ